MGELFPNQELDEAVAPLCVVCLEVGWPLRSLDRFLKFATAGRLDGGMFAVPVAGAPEAAPESSAVETGLELATVPAGSPVTAARADVDIAS